MRFALFSKAKSRRCTGPSTRSVCTLLRGAAAKEIKCKVESFTVEWDSSKNFYGNWRARFPKTYDMTEKDPRRLVRIRA